MSRYVKNPRYATCIRCKREWNVSRRLNLFIEPYVCPECASGKKARGKS